MCSEAFLKAFLKSFSFPATINPAAVFKATDCENSLEVPLYISIIFSELYSAFFPFKFSLFPEFKPSSLGSIVNSFILPSFNSTTFVFAKGEI